VILFSNIHAVYDVYGGVKNRNVGSVAAAAIDLDVLWPGLRVLAEDHAV
jgi:hypothetical protein